MGLSLSAENKKLGEGDVLGNFIYTDNSNDLSFEGRKSFADAKRDRTENRTETSVLIDIFWFMNPLRFYFYNWLLASFTSAHAFVCTRVVHCFPRNLPHPRIHRRINALIRPRLQGRNSKRRKKKLLEKIKISWRLTKTERVTFTSFGVHFTGGNCARSFQRGWSKGNGGSFSFVPHF